MNSFECQAVPSYAMNSPLRNNSNSLEAPVIAYPVGSTSPSPYKATHDIMNSNDTGIHMVSGSHLDDSMGAYSSSLGDANFADDTVSISGNFFSQLDSMILAVKNESSALDSMKERLKEVDGLRSQIQQFSKRLLDADQTNLNLKNQLVKAQETLNESKKGKAEAESSLVPLRQELNRTKDQCNKERMGRLAAQQEVSVLKEQVQRLEAMNEALDREAKSVPALTESNEIMKNDLSQLRRKNKEEKSAMQKHIKKLEVQAREADTFKGIVRELSLKLLDVANNGTGKGTTTATSSYSAVTGIASPGHSTNGTYSQPIRYSSNAPTMHQQSVGGNIYYQQQQQLQQLQQPSYSSYENGDDDEEEESDEEEEEDDDYDDNSYISDGTADSNHHSTASVGSAATVATAATTATAGGGSNSKSSLHHRAQHVSPVERTNNLNLMQQHQSNSNSNLLHVNSVESLPLSASKKSSASSGKYQHQQQQQQQQQKTRKKKSVVKKGSNAGVKRSSGNSSNSNGQVNMMHVMQDGGGQGLSLPRI